MTKRGSTREKVAIVAVIAVLLMLVILVKGAQRTEPLGPEVSGPDSQQIASAPRPIDEAESTASAGSEASPSSAEAQDEGPGASADTPPQPSGTSEEPATAASSPPNEEAGAEQPASDTAAEPETPPEPSETAPPGDAVASEPETEEAGDAQVGSTAPAESRQPKALPRLLDLGAGQCIPCKMMAPILEELGKEYEGRLHVEVLDVWENPAAAEPYAIRVIPTQIFYDTEGKEFYRNEGFLSKEGILRVFADHGIEL